MTDQAVTLVDDLPGIVLETVCVGGGTTLVLSDDLPFVGIGRSDPEPQMLMLEPMFVGPPGQPGTTDWDGITNKPTDLVHQPALDDETARAEAAEAALSTTIAGETARAMAAETALDGRVSTLEQAPHVDAYTKAETDTLLVAKASTQAVADETTAREASDAALAQDLFTETQRATAAEQALSDALAAHPTARVGDDESTAANAIVFPIDANPAVGDVFVVWPAHDNTSIDVTFEMRSGTQGRVDTIYSIRPGDIRALFPAIIRYTGMRPIPLYILENPMGMATTQDVAAEASARESADADTLATAEAHSAAGDATTLSSAETYADNKVALLRDSLKSSDAGNLLDVGSDAGLLFRGQLQVAAMDVGATEPSPNAGTSSIGYSTLLGCLMRWDGTAWQQASSAANNLTITETTGTEAGFQAAIAKALGYIMGSGKTITVQLASGTYNLADTSGAYSWSNKDFSRITIQGATPVVAAASSVYSVALISGKQYAVTLAVSSVAGMSVGNLVIVKPTAGPSYWASLHGAWPITAIDAVNNRVTFTLTTPTSFAPLTGALTATVTCLPTTLNTASGFSFTNCVVKSLESFGMTQNGSTAGVHALKIIGGATWIFMSNVGIYGFCNGAGVALWIDRMATVEVSAVGVGGTGGVNLMNGSDFYGTIYIGGTGAAFAANASGFWVFNNSTVEWEGSSAVVGGAYGIDGNLGARVNIVSDTSYNLTSNSTNGIRMWNFSTCNGVGFIASVTTSPAKNTGGNNQSEIFA